MHGMFQHIARFYNGHCWSTVIVHGLPTSLQGVDHIFIPLASKRELCVWPLRISGLQCRDDLFIAVPALPASVHRSPQNEDLFDAQRRAVPASLNELGDLTKDRQILLLRSSQRESLEERKDPLIEVDRSCHLEVEDAVWSTSYRSRAEGVPKDVGRLHTHLRHVERQ